MSSKNAIGRLAIFFLFALCIFAANAPAQTPAAKQTALETRVIDLNYCIKTSYEKPNLFFNNLPDLKASLSKYENARDCSELIKDIDFTKYTLMGVSIRNSECHEFPLTHKVIKDEAAGLYRFQVAHPPLSSPCAGLDVHELWVLAPKIPEGYNVVFEISEDANILRTREINLKGCIQLFRQYQMVIRDKEAFLKAIRNDASRESCVKDLEKSIDFNWFTLLGVNINSGYCRVPVGLRYNTIRDEAKKLYTLQASYIDPQGSVCRAMSSYDLWVLVPKMPEGYEAKFEVKAVER